jgi:hypothetical protein
MTHSLCRSVSRFVADLITDFIDYYRFINRYLNIYSLLRIKLYLILKLGSVKTDDSLTKRAKA